ncbi:MAG: hypothetical protein KDH20_21890 [Rhodocyclaceae bacterium]|nr:hypothetical protein [Rhodocyclaceae bacterium]
MSTFASPTLDSLDQLLARQTDAGLGRCHAAEDFEPLAAACGDLALLLTDDPARSPESWDMAVILPEVLKHFEGHLTAVAAMPEVSRELARRYGVTRYPSLLFVRGGAYVGVLEGVYDWQVLGPAVSRLLETPAGRAPSVGIPVTSAAPAGSCH